MRLKFLCGIYFYTQQCSSTATSSLTSEPHVLFPIINFLWCLLPFRRKHNVALSNYNLLDSKSHQQMYKLNGYIFHKRKWHNVILIDRTLLRVGVKFTALDGLLWISLEPNSQFYWMSFATQRWNACMNKHAVSDHFTFLSSNWSRYLLLYP